MSLEMLLLRLLLLLILAGLSRSERYWDLKGLKDRCDFSKDWLCNPDNMLLDSEADRVNSHFHYDTAYDGECQLKLNVILTKHLAEHLDFGQPQGVGVNPFHPARAYHWFNALKIRSTFLPRSYANPEGLKGVRLNYTYKPLNRLSGAAYFRKEDNSDKCCHTMLLVSKLERGRIRYAIGLCQNFPLQFCHIQEIFKKHDGGLYDHRYVRYGLKEMWSELLEVFRSHRDDLRPCPPIVSDAATRLLTPPFFLLSFYFFNLGRIVDAL